MTNEPEDVFKHADMRSREECWPWLGPFGGRPDRKRPYFMAHRKRTMASRWVWIVTYGAIPEGMLVLHNCDNGDAPIGCVNPHHMYLGTSEDNTKDMTDRQRHGLTHYVVRNIRRLIDQGRTQKEIGSLYGISRETVSAIATGRVYSHLSNIERAVWPDRPRP